MFLYPESLEDSKVKLKDKLNELKTNGYLVNVVSHNLENGLDIDKVIIRAKGSLKHRFILSSGLHGVEGYVGHCAIITFLDYYLEKLNDETEVVIYHTLNPYGMKYHYRTNQSNVDLNRNFSQNDFTTFNKDYEEVKDFFKPKLLKSKIKANSDYYLGLTNLIRKYGVPTLNNAILYGQNIDEQGLYYAGKEYQEETNYIINELDDLFKSVKTVSWVDVHTGFGPRYKMSIINSQYETDQTKALIKQGNYSKILGLQNDDVYEIDGDMIEFIYAYHKKKKYKSDLYATCYEYGTLGASTRKTIESLKSLAFINNVRYIETSEKVNQYAKHLVDEQFLPSEEKWRKKAYEDFLEATNAIMIYRNLYKKVFKFY